MPLKSGFFWASRGAIRRRASAARFIGYLLLRIGELVFLAGGEDHAPIRKSDPAARGVIGAVAGAETLDHDGHARLDDGFGDAAAHQLARRAAAEAPVRNLARSLFYVHIEPDMRILPLDLRDDAGHFDRLRLIEFGDERMMGQGRNCGENEGGSGSKLHFRRAPFDGNDSTGTVRKRSVNTVPLPGSERTLTEPFCRRMRSFTIARPRPVPRGFVV